MRSTKLVPALAAAATLLLTLPAGAAARVAGRRHSSPVGRCHVNIEVEPHLVTSGETSTVFGHLTCPEPGSAAGQTVTVYQRSAASPGFGVAGTPTTEADGSYQLTTTALLTNTVFYVDVINAQSGHRTVKVSPQVTLSGPPDGTQLFTANGRPRTRARNMVTFTGTVSPEDAGALVTLQREDVTGNEEWLRIDLGVVSGEGKFSISHGFVVPGDANIRVVVRPRAGSSAGASAPFSYEISRPQKPGLTIQASADPISYGQPVKISGTVDGAAAHQPVTLLAHTSGGHFTPVAQATANGRGEYAFSQTPLQNTSYRVTGASASSSLLFEGVKYALTAAASATTVQDGQSVTFTGTVAPTLIGHVVYLERRDAAGIGFHVLDVGTVATASTYSIVHTFFQTGEGIVRIETPGDPDNQGKASEPMAIHVIPTTAATLAPDAPGGSSLSTGGQF